MSDLGDALRALIRRPPYGWHPEGCDCHNGMAHGRDEDDPLFDLAAQVDDLSASRDQYVELWKRAGNAVLGLQAERDQLRIARDMLTRDAEAAEDERNKAEAERDYWAGEYDDISERYDALTAALAEANAEIARLHDERP